MSTLTKTIKLFAVSISASFIIANSSLMAAQTIKSNITNDWQDNRYIVHDDGTVTDSKTKLMWKVCSEGQTWSASDGTSACTGLEKLFTWLNALEEVNSLNFAGHRDWRVPNRNELLSLAARDRYSPAINTTIFPNTALKSFWSSSPYAQKDDLAWSVDFFNGIDSNAYRKDSYRLRLVRSSQ